MMCKKGKTGKTEKTIRKFPGDLRLYVKKGDPRVSLKIPAEMLIELTLSSIETGYSVESEILVRLAHSLIKKEQGI